MKTKKCKVCGTEFTTSNKSIYCCQQCRAAGVKEQKLEYHKKWIRQNKQHNSEYMREYYSDDEHYKKHLARCKANNLQRSGKSGKACKCQYQNCRCTQNLQQHHLSYDGWGAMATVTLCIHHHRALHAQENRDKKQVKCSVSIRCKVQQ